MAGETVKSIQLTNLDAFPSVALDPAERGGRKRIAIGKIELTTSDIQNTDIIKLVRLPSNAVPVSINLYNDDLDSNGSPTLTYDLGLYAVQKFTDASVNSGNPVEANAVIDADLFANAATDLQAANTAGANKRFSSLNIDTVDKQLWELIGAAKDTQTEYDLAATIDAAAATAAAGTLIVVVEYIID